ncbi:MAG: DUF6946 family protein [Caulobacterales bacterium]
MKNYPTLYGSPLLAPASVQPLLRDPTLHWKKGRSAYEGAHTWVTANLQTPGGWPEEVRELLASSPDWATAEVVTGFFEHATALDTAQRPTNSDLMIVAKTQSTLGVIAVEAKAGEPFGDTITAWNTSPGRNNRLEWACNLFGVDPHSCGPLRWQLFHRTAAALLEAKRFLAPNAIMLVHDFAAEPCWVDDYRAFAQALSFSEAGVDRLSGPRVIEGVSLQLGWVRGSHHG